METVISIGIKAKSVFIRVSLPLISRPFSYIFLTCSEALISQHYNHFSGCPLLKQLEFFSLESSIIFFKYMISYCTHTEKSRMKNYSFHVFCGFEDCNYIFLHCLLPTWNVLYFSTLLYLLNLLTFLQRPGFFLTCPYLSWYPKEIINFMWNLNGIWPTPGKIVPCYSFIETIAVEVTMHSRRTNAS